jgi:hypothetical protein
MRSGLMMSFVFVCFIVPAVVGLSIDIVRGRFRKKNVSDEVAVSEVGDAPEVADESRPQQMLQSLNDRGEKVTKAPE